MEPIVLATWGLVAATVTGAAFVAIAWTWIIRHNQRSALDRVDVLFGSSSRSWSRARLRLLRGWAGVDRGTARPAEGVPPR